MDTTTTTLVPVRRKTNLSDSERQAIVDLLRERRHQVGGTLQKGSISETPAAFNVKTKTISRIWAHASRIWALGGCNRGDRPRPEKIEGKNRPKNISLYVV
ncbi:unnamed protein product [Cuscuta epithymum]|uniref:DUF7769 domain-containing protein n=1 Tax=Cuscuta epithymum TaxID=186058 RepID=A0AAV0F4S0_9ASTE|nr:unnamed protein product [Cuscuta epithymum]